VRAVWRWIAVVLYCGLISYFSSKTGSDLPKAWWMKYDKVLHALEYSGLGFLVSLALLPLRTGWRIAAGAACGLLFGVVDEFHQSFVAGRQGNDPGDIAADLVGATLGAIGFALLLHLIGRFRSDQGETA